MEVFAHNSRKLSEFITSVAGLKIPHAPVAEWQAANWKSKI